MANPVTALVADHAGLELKNALNGFLDERGFETVDLGPDTAKPVDYPDMAAKLAAALKGERARFGVMTCGSGIGIAIAANRYPWVRAAMSYDVTTSRLAREHNDANVLALGAGLIGLEVARLLIDLSEYALCRGPPRTPRRQNVVRDATLILPP